MSNVGDRERLVQNRLVKLFQEQLGYRYLGFWKDRLGNSNVEKDLLTAWLQSRGVSDKLISRTLDQVTKAAALGSGRTLYDANRDAYQLLRYGVKVLPEVGEQRQLVWLIDWEHPENNDFAIAEEVTVLGVHDKRPDLVLYVNGIALAVIELKRSIVSVSEGIRQNLDSQKKEFIRPFFTTVQLTLAGNDTEGLRYAVIGTKEKYWLNWKEPSEVQNPLDRAVLQLGNKARLLELIHDFVVFDAGQKKIARHNQYFGVKAAQERVRRREGGIIWHTQGSGKSLTMIWLAKWIREHVANSRVLLITDRTELDDQIEKFFQGVDEAIYRTKSGDDLIRVLQDPSQWLMCSLIHKFGRSEEGDIDAFLSDVKAHLPKGFHAPGSLFVFVDECHRTQSGKLHKALTEVLPGAMFIGFTGTPLLKADKQTSIEIFGPYIHIYKYDEAVRDGVVLDLRYEARDIDQELASPEKVDKWFEAKTAGLTPRAKAQIKERWGTLQKVLSSKSRLEKIVDDILMDMETKDRLKSGHGNAILVTASIYQACRVYEMLRRTDLKDKCAIVTSYRPSHSEIKGEETGEGDTEKLEQYDIYRKMLADYFDQTEDAAINRVDEFETKVKEAFIEKPEEMKLLIVVDKLLTGFDAPPATYLYIDKQMRDHGLFQAICRVNRLDSEDKDYGYIVDYKDLFKSLAQSVHDYTSEAFEGYDAEDVVGLLKNRIEAGRQRLDQLLESVRALCEDVEPPRDTAAYCRYFCGKGDADPDELAQNEPRRLALYKVVGSLLRAYADIAADMGEAGYSNDQATAIKDEVGHYEKVREEVKLASGDYIDMKLYEPAMRHLLDSYIEAEDSQKLSTFDDLSLVELIVERGEDALGLLPAGFRKNREAMAEVIENNVRRLIVDEMAVNPKYYDQMSQLLDSIIQARKHEALDYKAYLERIQELAQKVTHPETASGYPAGIDSKARRALYDNLGNDADLALRVDSEIRKVKKADWRGNKVKEREVKIAIKNALGVDGEQLDSVFDLVKAQDEY